jgi:hypothetical protein
MSKIYRRDIATIIKILNKKRNPLLSLSRYTILAYRMADYRMTALWERSGLQQWPA